MQPRAIDAVRGYAREAAYMLALFTAIAVLWIHAWAASISSWPTYTGSAVADPTCAPVELQPAVATADGDDDH